MKRAMLLTLIAILAVVSLAACGSNKGPEAAPAKATVKTSQTATVPAATDPEVDAEAPVADEDTGEAEETTEPEATPEPEATEDNTLNLEDRQQGLDKLKSYRMTWVAEWSGKNDGKAENGSWNWVEEYSSDPKGLHWSWDVKDSTDASKGGKMEMWQVGNTTYMATTDKECISMSSDESNQINKGGIFNPSSLGSVENARLVGDDTINGVRARHYKYDDKASGMLGLGQVSGEIWVANDGGYVVKEITNWKGGAGLFGMGSTGTEGEGKWTWELSNVDQPVTIEPPKDCGGAANEMPVMADATGKSSFGDTLTYSTAGKIADVVAFYEKEMPAAGWKQDGEPTTTEDMAMLSYAKDDQTAQIIISKNDDKTSVVISISK